MNLVELVRTIYYYISEHKIIYLSTFHYILEVRYNNGGSAQAFTLHGDISTSLKALVVKLELELLQSSYVFIYTTSVTQFC